MDMIHCFFKIILRMCNDRRRQIRLKLLQFADCRVQCFLDQIKMFTVHHEITSKIEIIIIVCELFILYTCYPACSAPYLHTLQKIFCLNIRLIKNILSGSDVEMSYKDRLDQHSELFHHNWTRPKRSKSQVNGHTEMSQTNIILRSNAKAHRW